MTRAGGAGRITIYINSPGGSFTALTAIYDTMQYIKPLSGELLSRPAPRS